MPCELVINIVSGLVICSRAIILLFQSLSTLVMSCNFTTGNWFMFKQHIKLLERSIRLKLCIALQLALYSETDLFIFLYNIMTFIVLAYHKGQNVVLKNIDLIKDHNLSYRVQFSQSWLCLTLKRKVS